MSRIFIALAFAFSLIASAAIAKEFSSVEEQMSSKEFKAAGLDKLSPEELAALNAWVRNNQSTNTVVYNRASDDRVRVGFEDSDNRDEVSSNIAGEFNGWHRGTQFKLENGQVWQVDDYSELTGIKVMTSPRVTIHPGLIGGWRLKVEGYNSVAGVIRIK